MWTRNLLKTNAKIVLHRTYWRAFLICICTGLLAGGGSGIFSWNAARSGSSGSSDSYSTFGQGDEFHIPPEIAGIFIVLMLLGLVAGVAYSVFIAAPVLVGQSRYFMEARAGNAPFLSLFSVFGKPGYGNVVKVSFLTQLYIFLWSLLLIVPGIIKSYEYCLVPYILSERPDMDTSRALELSRTMTDGEKWNIFVLGLSFLGWELLGMLCLGIGVLFVTPYVQATTAELYTALRTKAIANGAVSADELPGFIAYP
ncbi:MAG: DUF975 family protein [Ruthenibacterium sp.]